MARGINSVLMVLLAQVVGFELTTDRLHKAVEAVTHDGAYVDGCPIMMNKG